MSYIDGFVMPIPRKNLPACKKLAAVAGKVWKEHGALGYFECQGDDLKIKGTLSFLKMAKAKPDETAVFAWIIYKSKAHRDKVNALVMKDPRKAKVPQPMPFDPKKMACGGFKSIVSF